MNVVRVIYLDQNIVVDVCECMRSSKEHGRSEQRALRLEIERCVDESLAIFPYSEVHLRETANVSDQESRTEQVTFWNKISQRYRFHDARAVEVNQLHAILEQRPVRFSRELAIHQSPLTFDQELPGPDLEAKKQRAESFKVLAKYWAGKLTHDLSGTIRHREVDGIIRLILEDLTNFLRTGTFPLHRIFSKHNDLHSELCWHLRDQGSAKPFEDALCWLQTNALRIPSLLIDFLATEYVAEQFATDAKFRRKVEKAETDHDANDIEAAGHWFPYVDYVFTDKKMATFMFPKLRKELSRRVYPFHLSTNKPLLFSSRREFLKFLTNLKPTESVASVESETQDDRGAAKTLLYILRTPNRLISKETIYEEPDVNAEILSGGGLRIDVRSPEKSWDAVKSYFRQFRDYLREDGEAATLTTVEWEDHLPIIKSALLTFGILSVKIGDIRGELHCDLSEHS